MTCNYSIKNSHFIKGFLWYFFKQYKKNFSLFIELFLYPFILNMYIIYNKKEMKQIQQFLETLGLTKNEISIYITSL